MPIIHVSILGDSPNDSQIWEYAKEKELVIVTKDADFSDRLMVDLFPPKIVHLRFGSMRKREFHSFLAQVWPEIEMLVIDHKLQQFEIKRGTKMVNFKDGKKRK